VADTLCECREMDVLVDCVAGIVTRSAQLVNWVSLESGEHIEPADRFEYPRSMLPLLGSSVNFQGSASSLSHRSVKEFLECPGARRGSLRRGLSLGMRCPTILMKLHPQLNIFIAKECLRYLASSHTPARETTVPRDVKGPNTMYLLTLQRAYPLLEYCVRMWSHHLRKPMSQLKTLQVTEDTLRCDNKGRPSL